MKTAFVTGILVVALLGATVHAQTRSYLLVADDAALPANLEASVAAAGGRVTLLLPQIGVAVVESSNDRFTVSAGAIVGISSVLPDVAWDTEAPLYGSMHATEDEAGAQALPPITDA